MISSQSSAQPAEALSSETETGTKRIVTSQGFCSRRDPPRSQLETEPRLLKNPTERKYSFYEQLLRVDSDFWPVISANPLIETLSQFILVAFASCGRITA
jgi:hypothetical protein